MTDEKALPDGAEVEYQGNVDLSQHPDGPPDPDLDTEADDEGDPGWPEDPELDQKVAAHEVDA